MAEKTYIGGRLVTGMLCSSMICIGLLFTHGVVVAAITYVLLTIPMVSLAVWKLRK